MPFGGYESFEACLMANHDKADPKAYCGALQAAAEKALEADTARRGFRIAKLDEAERKVYGWASVAVDHAGEPVLDLQGDLIAPADLEKAAHEFVLFSRAADEMHRGGVKGQLVESLMVTPEKLAAMGLSNQSAPQAGWWIGFKVDADAFAKVKDGTYTAFSIAGEATRELVTA